MSTVALPSAGVLVAFLLAMVRVAGWLVICPPFNNPEIPARVKVGIAAALALPEAGRLATAMPADLPAFAVAVLVQSFVGLALGVITLVFFAAVESAGQLIDLSGGFTTAALFNPMTNSSDPVVTRLLQLIATTTLFASGGVLLLVRGLLSSYDAVPLTAGVSLGRLAGTLSNGIGTLLVSALEIAAPVLAALFLADVALALLTRAAPQFSIFNLGFGLKIALTLALLGTTIAMLPESVARLLDDALRAGAGLLTGG